MKIEIFPRAESDIIRQFRYYLVDQDRPRRRSVRRILKQEKLVEE